MSPIVNVPSLSACLLALVTTGVLAQTEVPAEINNVNLHDPRNLPLALQKQFWQKQLDFTNDQVLDVFGS